MSTTKGLWLTNFVAFLAIFVLCIASVFAPVKINIEQGDMKYTAVFGAGSLQGLDIMADIWADNTTYFVFIAVISIIAIGGSVWSIIQLQNETTEGTE